MAQAPVSVTIITLNEEENISRALSSVKWAKEVIVVDSGSTDKTLEIAKNFGAKVVTNNWPGYGKQKNHAHDLAQQPWVLNIDADEEVPEELAREIQTTIEQCESGKLGFSGFMMPRKTFYLNQWIEHGGWYPNYLVRLARKSQARWTEPAVHEALEVQGEVGKLTHPLNHFTFSCIEDQILTNLRYSRFGTKDLQRKGQSASLLKLIFKPIGKFIETYFIKLGLLDGIAGFIISINAAHSIFLKYAYLFEGKMRDESTDR